MNGKDAFFYLVPDMGQEVEEPLGDELTELREEATEEASEPERDLLQHYINEASRIPLLDPEETRRYSLRYQSDDEAKKNEAHAVLVRHNLRLVIRIAFDFKNYWMSNMLDLIQEGNIGLMHAIKKFEPDREIKLSYYASFWIKAYILSFLMKNCKLVKIGTTVAQRKLFYNLKREKDRLRALGFDPDPEAIAKSLNVKESEVDEMEQRLSGRELSLDAPLKEGSKEHHLNFLPAIEPQVVNTIAEAKKEALLHQYLAEFRLSLKPKELDILNLRLLADKPLRLEVIGGLHQVSRERIRQIEARMIQKFGIFLKRKEAEEKKQWAKNLIKNLIRERDEKKSKRFVPIRQSGDLNDEFTIKWINPDEIDPPAKSDKNGLEKTEAPPPMPALKTRTEKFQKENTPMDNDLPKITHLFGYYFAGKLRDKNINETSDLLKLSILQFEKLGFKPRTIQAIVSEMLKAGYSFSDGEEATRAFLMTCDPKTYRPPTEPPGPGAAASAAGSNLAASVAEVSESPLHKPLGKTDAIPSTDPAPERSLRATLKRFSSAFDFMTLNEGNPDKFEGEETFTAENGQEYNLSVTITRKFLPV